MPFTVNKNLSVPTAGSLTGVWGEGSPESINAGVTTPVDRMLGGTVAKSLASADVTLTTEEAQNAVIRLTGILPANRVVTNSNVGFYFVENLTTGSFSVTVTNGVAGVVVPQGQRVILVADATNGVRLFGGSLGYVIGTTKQTFVNSTVPTGWAADTSVTNGTLRIVGSAGGGSGGSANFTDVFAARTLVAGNIPLLTTGGQSQDHSHQTAQPAAKNGNVAGGDLGVWRGNGGNTNTGGVSQDHTHQVGNASPTPLDFAVKYRDAIIGTYGG